MSDAERELLDEAADRVAETADASAVPSPEGLPPAGAAADESLERAASIAQNQAVEKQTQADGDGLAANVKTTLDQLTADTGPVERLYNSIMADAGLDSAGLSRIYAQTSAASLASSEADAAAGGVQTTSSSASRASLSDIALYTSMDKETSLPGETAQMDKQTAESDETATKQEDTESSGVDSDVDKRRKVKQAILKRQSSSIDKAYSLWNQKTGGSTADFRKAMAETDPEGTASVSTAVKLAGVKSVADLDKGTWYSGFGRAVKENLGQSVIKKNKADAARRRTENALASNTVFMHNTGMDGRSTDDMKKLISVATQQVRLNPELSQTGPDDRLQMLRSMDTGEFAPEVVNAAIAGIKYGAPSLLDAESADDTAAQDASVDKAETASKSVSTPDKLSVEADSGHEAQSTFDKLKSWLSDTQAVSNTLGKVSDLLFGGQQQETGSRQPAASTLSSQRQLPSSSSAHSETTQTANSMAVQQAASGLALANATGTNSVVERERLATAQRVTGSTGSSVVDKFMATDNDTANATAADWAGRLSAVSGRSDESSRYLGNVKSLLESGGDFGALSQEQQQQMRMYGYGSEAAENIRKAKLDVLGYADRQHVSGDYISRAMQAVNQHHDNGSRADNGVDVASGAKEALESAYTDTPEASTSKTGIGGIVKDISGTVKNSIGAVKGMLAGADSEKSGQRNGRTDKAGSEDRILDTIAALLRQAVSSLDSIRGNTEPGNTKADRPGTVGRLQSSNNNRVRT